MKLNAFLCRNNKDKWFWYYIHFSFLIFLIQPTYSFLPYKHVQGMCKVHPVYRVNQNEVSSYSGLKIRTRLLWIWCKWDMAIWSGQDSEANQLVATKKWYISCHSNQAHHSMTLISDSPCKHVEGMCNVHPDPVYGWKYIEFVFSFSRRNFQFATNLIQHCLKGFVYFLFRQNISFCWVNFFILLLAGRLNQTRLEIL